MNCKDVQASIAVGLPLRRDQANHAEGCVRCQSFRTDVARIEAKLAPLEATVMPTVMPDLRETIRARLGKSKLVLNWRSLAIAVPIFLIVCAPTAAYVAARLKHQSLGGEPYGACPPFHETVYGMNRMSKGDPCKANIWYSGHALRVAFPGWENGTGSMDMLDWISGDTVYQSWKPDGAAQTRVSFFGGGAKETPDQARLLFRWNAPLTPLAGKILGEPTREAIIVGGQSYQTMVTTYELKVQPGPEWTTVEVPTRERVFCETGSNRIVRIAYDATFGAGPPQTETHDFEYGPIPDSLFDPENLRPTQTTFPARRAEPPKP